MSMETRIWICFCSSDEKLDGSRSVLGSRTLLNVDDYGGSMNEYRDVDASKLNEDGSFVGCYNTADRKLTGRSDSLANM
jgi:Bravo-like intracellular region